MENYEQKYKEALERARKMYNEDCDICQSCLEQLFPELAESEDEKIRKELLEHCKNQAKPYIQTGNKCPQIQSWIAWLEKQGEQKESYDTCVSATLNGKKLPYGEKRDFGHFEKQGEQKPIKSTKSEEWYKELSLSLQIQAYLNTVSDELYAKGKPLYSEKRIEDVHKCMKMWTKLHNSYFYGEQKPVEWSEEDEEILNTIINHFEIDLECTENDDIIRWLKSLHSKPK